MVRKILYLIMGLGLFLSSCTQATVQATPTLYPTGLLTPYHTITPKPVTPTATIMVTIPVTPAPTPTPFLHTVTNDDTMLGIAYQYGISLEDLQAANPRVDPHYMSVGMQLIIPIGGEIPEVVPTPTAIPVHVKQPHCYQAGDGGAWCIIALRNEMDTSLENLSVWIGLYTPQGEIIASQVAYAPLNILHPDSTLPLMAYFAPPLSEDFEARSEVLSALAVATDDPRYLDLQVKTEMVEINPDGKQAVIRGDVILPEDIPTPSQIWALAVAYDPEGDIIGARKWKSVGETHFEITVYSVGGRIDHVEVLTEIRP
jgi:LysM repeat protein